MDSRKKVHEFNFNFNIIEAYIQFLSVPSDPYIKLLKNGCLLHFVSKIHQCPGLYYLSLLLLHISVLDVQQSHISSEVFVAHLSACVFEWDSENVANLRHTKRRKLARCKIVNISEGALTRHISHRELAVHCRRKKLWVEETTRLIHLLIDIFDSENRKDSLGVLVLGHDRLQKIWMDQKKHIWCIEDPEDFPLHIKTGTLKK